MQCDHSGTDGIRQVCFKANSYGVYRNWVRSLAFGYVYNYISIPNGLSFTVVFLSKLLVTWHQSMLKLLYIWNLFRFVLTLKPHLNCIHFINWVQLQFTGVEHNINFMSRTCPNTAFHSCCIIIIIILNLAKCFLWNVLIEKCLWYISFFFLKVILLDIQLFGGHWSLWIVFAFFSLLCLTLSNR